MSDLDDCDDCVSGGRGIRRLRLVSSDDDNSSGSDSDDSLSDGGDGSDSERSGDPAGNGAEVGSSSADSGSSDSDSAEVCAICLSSFRGQEIGNPESCDHNFCLDHILEWAKNVSTCPVDRQAFAMVLVRNVPGGKITRRVAIEEKDMLEEPDDDPTYCEVCGQCDREDRLLLCDGCDGGYHLDCLQPPLLRVPEDEWYCSECTPASNTATLAAEVGITQDELISLLDEERLSVSALGGATGRISRPLARTRLAERIRARVPPRLSPAPNSACGNNASRSRTSRPSANRSTSASGGGRRKRRTTKRKTKKSTSKRSRSKRTGKRKKSRRKTTKRSVRNCRSDLSSGHDVTRQHLRRLLAIRRFKPGQMAPPAMGERRVAGIIRSSASGSSDGARDRSLAIRRRQAGIPSLSLFGTRDDLGPAAPGYDEDDLSGGEDACVLARAGGGNTLCVSAPARNGLLGHSARRLKSRLVSSPTNSVATESASGDDVLAQILSSQTLLLSQSRQMRIERDGRLSLVARPGCSVSSTALTTSATGSDAGATSPSQSAPGACVDSSGGSGEQMVAGEEASSSAPASDTAGSSNTNSISSSGDGGNTSSADSNKHGSRRLSPLPAPPISPNDRSVDSSASTDSSRPQCNGKEQRGSGSGIVSGDSAAATRSSSSPLSVADCSPSPSSQQAYADYYYSSRQRQGDSPEPEPLPGDRRCTETEGTVEDTNRGRADDDDDDDIGLYSDIEPPASATSSRDEVVDDFDECDMDGPDVSGTVLSSRLTVPPAAVACSAAVSGVGADAACLPYTSDVSSDEDLVIDDSACNRSPSPANSLSPPPPLAAAARLTEVISSPESFHEEEMRRCSSRDLAVCVSSHHQHQNRFSHRVGHVSAASLLGTEQISDSEQPHDFDDGIEEGEIPSIVTKHDSVSPPKPSVSSTQGCRTVSHSFSRFDLAEHGSSAANDGDVEEGEITPPLPSLPMSQPSITADGSPADTGDNSRPDTWPPLDMPSATTRDSDNDEDDDGMIEEEEGEQRPPAPAAPPLSTAPRSSSEHSQTSVVNNSNMAINADADDDAPAIDEEIAQFVISEKTHTVVSMADADDHTASDPIGSTVCWKKVTKSTKSRNYRDVTRPSSSGDRSAVRASRLSGDRSAVRASRLSDDDVRRVINSRRKRRKHSRRSRSASREQRVTRRAHSRSRRSRSRSDRHSATRGRRGSRSPAHKQRRKRSRRHRSGSAGDGAGSRSKDHQNRRRRASPVRQRRVWLSPVDSSVDLAGDKNRSTSHDLSGEARKVTPHDGTVKTASTSTNTASCKKKKSTARDEPRQRRDKEDVSKAIVADGNNLLISLNFSRLGPRPMPEDSLRQKSVTPPALPSRTARSVHSEQSVSPLLTEPDVHSPGIPSAEVAESRPKETAVVTQCDSIARSPRRSRQQFNRRRRDSQSSISSRSSTPPSRRRRLGGAGGALRRPPRLSPVDIDVIEVPTSDHEPIVISDGSDGSSSDEVLPASPPHSHHSPHRLSSPSPSQLQTAANLPSRGPHTPPEPSSPQNRLPSVPKAGRCEVRQALSRPVMSSDSTVVKFTLSSRSTARALHPRVNPLLGTADRETCVSPAPVSTASLAAVSVASVLLPASVPIVSPAVPVVRGPSTPPEPQAITSTPSTTAPARDSKVSGGDGSDGDDGVDTYDPFEPTHSPDLALPGIPFNSSVTVLSSPSATALSVPVSEPRRVDDTIQDSPASAVNRTDEQVTLNLFADLPPPKVNTACSPHSTFAANASSATAFSFPDTTRPPPVLSPPPPVNGHSAPLPPVASSLSPPITTDMELDSPVSVDSPDSRDCDDLFEPPLDVVTSPPQSSAPSPPSSRPTLHTHPPASAPHRSRNKPAPSTAVVKDGFDALFSTDSVRTVTTTSSGGAARERRSAPTGGASSHIKRKSLTSSRTPAKSTTAQRATAAARKTISQQLDKLMGNSGIADDRILGGEELPDSAVDMQVKEKYLKKLNRQERVVEEVKLVLKPYYHRRTVNKLQYKEILRKAVPKICHSKSGEINPNKIQALVVSYVRKYKHANKRQHKVPGMGGDQAVVGTVPAAGTAKSVPP